MVISGFNDLELQTDNYDIVSRYFNNLILCSMFLKEEAKHNWIKELVNKYCQYFQF